MAQKLPVGEVLNEAFQFGLHRWMTVIRFLWLPFVLSMTLIIVAVAFVFDFQAAAAAETMEGFDAFKEILRFPLSITGFLIFAAYLGMFVLISGGIASIFRLVALGEDRPGVFQLRLDGPAWRVFWAFVIMGLLGAVVQGISFLAAIAITGQSPAEFFRGMWAFFQLAAEAETGAEPSMEEMQPLLSAMGVFLLTFVIALVPMIYLNVRLAPFPAGSAAENRLLFFGAFSLSKGNFWPIFAAYLLLVLLMMLIGVVFQIVFAVVTALVELMAAMGSGLALIGAVVSVLVFAFLIFYYAFLYGVQFSFQAIIYRRLKTGQ